MVVSTESHPATEPEEGKSEMSELRLTDQDKKIIAWLEAAERGKPQPWPEEVNFEGAMKNLLKRVRGEARAVQDEKTQIFMKKGEISHAKGAVKHLETRLELALQAADAAEGKRKTSVSVAYRNLATKIIEAQDAKAALEAEKAEKAKLEEMLDTLTAPVETDFNDEERTAIEELVGKAGFDALARQGLIAPTRVVEEVKATAEAQVGSIQEMYDEMRGEATYHKNQVHYLRNALDMLRASHEEAMERMQERLDVITDDRDFLHNRLNDVADQFNDNLAQMQKVVAGARATADDVRSLATVHGRDKATSLEFRAPVSKPGARLEAVSVDGVAMHPDDAANREAEKTPKRKGRPGFLKHVPGMGGQK